MFVLYVAAAYLLGCVSPSIIQGRMRGIDIKKEGSGNAGTTNTLRVLGKKAALITLAVDILKGVLAVELGALNSPLCSYICAVAVCVGHIWPVFYGFKGGKGVATTFGALLGVNPLLALICLAVVVIVVLITRYVSAGSLCGAVTLAIAAPFIQNKFWPEALIIALIVIVKHRSNIRRLLRGEESKLSFKGER